MVKSKKILILIMMVIILMGLSYNVMAANSLNLQITSPNSTTNTTTNATTNTTTNSTTNTTSNISAPITNTQQTNTEGSVYKNNNLPQTGITEDYSMIALIIVCVISAIYAFKKIREYNEK